MNKLTSNQLSKLTKNQLISYILEIYDLVDKLEAKAEKQKAKTSKKKAKKVDYYNEFKGNIKRFKNGLTSVINSFKQNDKNITDEKIKQLLKELKTTGMVVFKNRKYMNEKTYKALKGLKND